SDLPQLRLVGPPFRASRDLTTVAALRARHLPALRLPHRDLLGARTAAAAQRRLGLDSRPAPSRRPRQTRPRGLGRHLGHPLAAVPRSPRTRRGLLRGEPATADAALRL